jgi:hypothetical protein
MKIAKYLLRVDGFLGLPFEKILLLSHNCLMLGTFFDPEEGPEIFL